MTVKSINGAPRKFDQSELERRQAKRRNAYNQTKQCMDLVRGEIAYNFLCSVIQKSNLGYVLNSSLPITTDSLSYSAYMTKPPYLQEIDLAAGDEEERELYILELENELARYKVELTKQLIEADATKELKKQEAAKTKRLLEIAAEVENTFSDLGIPD